MKFNRRTFLKTVPAIGLLAVAKPNFAQVAAAGSAGGGGGGGGGGDKPIAADAAGIIKLNPPDLARAVPLMQALKNRQSTRSYSDAQLSLQQLSDLLWAADGTNRADNKRTAPAAMGVYAVDVYAFLPDGVYLYDPLKHQLSQVVKGDNRKATGSQDFVPLAALSLVYVSNPKPASDMPGVSLTPETRKAWADVEAGCMVQNVYLYCAAAGLASVVRALFDANTLAPILKLKPDQLIITQSVGFPK
jgi:nitroreductase